MTVKLSLMLMALFVAGCAAVVKPITTPEGKLGFLVECDGSADRRIAGLLVMKLLIGRAKGSTTSLIVMRAAPPRLMVLWYGAI